MFHVIRLHIIRPIIILLAFLLLSPISSFGQYSPNQNLSIVVRVAKLRETASHWSHVVADLAYGSPVNFVSQTGEWAEVETVNKIKGFIHTSALTARRIVLVAGAFSEDQGAAVTDVVLAGKGFNSDVEDLYQEQVDGLDMAPVDDWERELVSDEDLTVFLRAGELRR